MKKRTGNDWIPAVIWRKPEKKLVSIRLWLLCNNNAFIRSILTMRILYNSRQYRNLELSLSRVMIMQFIYVRVHNSKSIISHRKEIIEIRKKKNSLLRSYNRVHVRGRTSADWSDKTCRKQMICYLTLRHSRQSRSRFTCEFQQSKIVVFGTPSSPMICSQLPPWPPAPPDMNDKR